VGITDDVDRGVRVEGEHVAPIQELGRGTSSESSRRGQVRLQVTVRGRVQLRRAGCVIMAPRRSRILRDSRARAMASCVLGFLGGEEQEEEKRVRLPGGVSG
jgi:hypothetical protein